MKGMKTTFQKELDAKMKDRKKKGLTTEVSSGSEDALDSDDEMLSGFKPTQGQKQSSWNPPTKNRGNSSQKSSPLDSIFKRDAKKNIETDDDDDDDDYNNGESLMKTMKTPWQPPTQNKFSKNKSSIFDKEEDELKSVWKNTTSKDRGEKDNFKEDRKSPKDIFTSKSPNILKDKKLSKDIFHKESPSSFLERKSPKEIFGAKSPKDFSERKSPKDSSERKSPKDFSERKSPKEIFNSKSPRDIFERKSPKELSSGKSPRDFSERKSPLDFLERKSPLQSLETKSPRFSEKQSNSRFGDKRNEKNSMFPDEIFNKKSPRAYTKDGEKKSPNTRKSLEDVSPVPTPRSIPKIQKDRPVPQARSRTKSRSPRNENMEKSSPRRNRYDSDSDSDGKSPRRLKSLNQDTDNMYSKKRSKSSDHGSKFDKHNSKSPSYDDEKFHGKSEKESTIEKRTRFSLSSSKQNENSDDDEDVNDKFRRNKSFDKYDDKMNSKIQTRKSPVNDKLKGSASFRKDMNEKSIRDPGSFSQKSKSTYDKESNFDKRISPNSNFDRKSKDMKYEHEDGRRKSVSKDSDSDEENSAFKPTPILKNTGRVSSGDNMDLHEKEKKIKEESISRLHSKNSEEERRSSICEEFIIEPDKKMMNGNDKNSNNKSKPMRKEQELINEVLNEVENEQRTMRYIDPERATESKNGNKKVNTIKKVKPKPRYEVARPVSSREFNSTLDLRQNIYAEWYEDRMKTSKMEFVEKKKKEKEAEENKKREEIQKKVDAKLAFNAWMDTKKDFGKDKIVAKKQEKEIEIKQKEGDLEKKKDAFIAYKIWKENKDVELNEKANKKKAEEKNKLKQENRKKMAKVKDASKAFEKWKERKEDIIFYEQEKEYDEKIKKEKEEKRHKKMQEREAEELYRKWLEKKENQGDQMKRSRSSLSLNGSVPAWSPPGRTIPVGR